MKKGWLRDRKVAIVITIIVMICSTGFGVHRSLEDKGEYAEWVFYHGSFGDGGGIQDELDTRAGLASNLLVVAGRYLDSEDEAVQRLKEARETLVTADGIGEKYLANEFCKPVWQPDEDSEVLTVLKKRRKKYKDHNYQWQLGKPIERAPGKTPQMVE